MHICYIVKKRTPDTILINHMKKDRKQAIVFRQSGMSYSEIKARLGVAKSTLSDWFKGEKWSNEIAVQCAKKARDASAIRLVVLNTVRAGRLEKVYEEARQDAFLDFAELKYHPLFIAGVMIYRSHGEKTSPNRISVSSMDPSTIRMFRLFLDKVCGIKKIRAQLLLGADWSRENQIRAEWIETCGFIPENFIKSVRIKAKKPTNKPYFGVCNIIVNSAYLKNKILKWTDLLAEDIGQEKYLEPERV